MANQGSCNVDYSWPEVGARYHFFKKMTYRTPIFVLVLLFTCLAVTAQAQDFAGGTGTVGDPYQVAEAAHLDNVRLHLNAHFLQTADIDLDLEPWNQGEGWDPIGTPGSSFQGTYDGNGYVISGLSINRPEAAGNNIGLFGVTGANSEILGVHLVNVDVTGNSNVGGLVGSNSGTVAESFIDGEVKGVWDPVGGLAGYNSTGGIISGSWAGTEVNGYGDVGGLVGSNYGSVIRCASTGPVTGNVYHIGGLVGENYGTISESHATGAVTLEVIPDGNKWGVGGLVGYNCGPISDSYASGPVTVVGLEDQVVWAVGGLVGHNDARTESVGTITKCHYNGTIVVSNMQILNYLGGLIGLNEGEGVSDSHAMVALSAHNNNNNEIGGLIGSNADVIVNCYSKGSVTVDGEFATSVGGLVGENGTNGEIIECHSTSSVASYASGSGDTGGLVSRNRGLLRDSHATGNVNGVWGAGGLVATNTGTGTILRCYATGDVTGNSPVGGLVGSSSGDILKSFAEGDVTGNDISGGLAGRNYGSVESSYATGMVDGNKTVGGLVGYNFGSVERSYARGAVTGNEEVGGLVGYNRSTTTYPGSIEECYATGTVTAAEGSDGGLIGKNDGSVTRSYWDILTSGQADSAGGEGRTTEQMTFPHDTVNTYLDWDFADTWSEDAFPFLNDGYPYLTDLPPSSPGILSPVHSGTLVAGDVLRFRGAGADDDGATYAWDFGDGLRTSSLRDPGLVGFPNIGEFLVVFSATVDDTEILYQASRYFDVIEDTGDIPDLQVTGVHVPAGIAAGQPVDIRYTVRNSGPGNAVGPWVDAIYLSSDPYLDVNDTLLASESVSQTLNTGGSYENTITATLPPLEEELYYLILVVNDGWRLLETRRLNNEHSVPVSVNVPSLEKDQLVHFSYNEGLVAQYFRIPGTAGESLLLNLQDAQPGLEAYVSFGTLPSRSKHDYRVQGGQLLIPANTSGDWYILVSGIMPREGGYRIGYEAHELILTGNLPSSHGTDTDLQLIVSGSGFIHPMEVELVNPEGGVYHPETVEVDSFSRAAAYFMAGTLPPDRYTVRVSRNGRQSERLEALNILAAAESQARLEMELILPSRLSYSRLATLYVEYANTGNVPMPAPVMVVYATQHGEPGAYLTLDKNRISRGLWSSARPHGFANSVQFLASGETPGILQPGESGRIPVYYAGWEKPWDMDEPPTDWHVYAMGSNDTTALDWDGFKDQMKPAYLTGEAWEVIWENYKTLAGNTWGQYVSMLNRNALYLYRQGHRVNDLESLVALSFRQAGGINPMPVIAQSTDAFVEGTGFPIIFERTYLHAIAARFEEGPFGMGWIHNWQIGLNSKDDGTVVIVGPTGTPRIFQPDIRYPGRYLSPPNDDAVLRDWDGGYRLTEPDGLVHFFSADGRLDYIEDTNGNRITCSYSGDLLTKLAHTSGAYLEIAYAGGLVSSIEDHFGKKKTYEYSGDYLTAFVSHDGQKTVYDYHATPGPRQHTLETIVRPDGTTLHFTYDEHGRLARRHFNDNEESIDITYVGPGQVNMTNALGQTNRFFFDEWGRLLRMENPLGEAVRYGFDDSGNKIAVTGPDGHVTRFSHDRRGNIVGMTDAMRQTTQFTFARSLNRRMSVTTPSGMRTLYEYDERGNPVSTILQDGQKKTWDYDASGNPVAWTNMRGQTVTYTFDDYGRMTQKSYDGDDLSKFTYDDRGNLVGAENPHGKTTFQYNDKDYLVRVDYPGGRWLTFEYDEAGRRKSSNQNGRIVNYHYNASGRLASLSDGNGTELVSYTYDALGRLIQKTLGNGAYAVYEYDSAERLLSLKNYNAEGVILSSYEYTYDRRGRRIAMQTHYGKWSYEYDDIGQLVRAELESSDTNVVGNQLLNYEYDIMGNRVRTIVNGQETNYAVNALDQYEGKGNRTYEYDADGNLVKATDPDGSWTEYTYSSENRLLSVERYGTSGNLLDEFQYTYDALGNRVVVDENGAVTHHVIDPAGLGSIVGSYDDVGALKAHYVHGHGLVSSWDGSGSSRSYYTFDPMGNTSAVTGHGGTVQNTYAYLPFGNTLIQPPADSNPFRFMGKYGVIADAGDLHFARARYYDAGMGRFTTRDPIGFGGGDVNLYRYVFNSPIDAYDPLGLSRVCGAVRGGKGLLEIKSGYTVFALGAGIAMAPGMVSLAAGGAVMTLGVAVMYSGAAYIQDSYYGDQLSGSAAKSSSGGVFDETMKLYGTADTIKSGYEAGTAFQAKRFWQGTTGTLEVVYSAIAEPFCNWMSDPVENPEPPKIEDPPLPVTPPPQPAPVRTVNAYDPNQKLSIAGHGERNFVPQGSTLSYHIDFENLETATAPAQVVTIRDPLSGNLDLSTFELTGIGFGEILVDVPAGLKFFETIVEYDYVDDEYDFEIDVHIEAWLEQGAFNVNFISIDPATGLPPQDAGVGFLPPENETGRGQGFVSYMVHPKPDLPSGTEIRNIADIQFDFGFIIATNQIDPLDPSQGTSPDLEALVTFDALPPTSAMEALPPVSTAQTFTVSWGGEDDEFGSGIRGYDIHVRENGGPWTTWLQSTALTSEEFTGSNGSTYDFYSVATDNVGYREEKDPVVEAFTLIDVSADAGDPPPGPPAPPVDDTPGEDPPEPPAGTEITHDNQVVAAGTTLANKADHDGVLVEAGGTVNNYAALSNLTNHGTINGGVISGRSINTGLLNQVEIAPGTVLDNAGGTVLGGVNNGSVFGGSIAGNMLNNGILSGTAPDGMPDADYTLVIEPGAVVTGGTLEGEIVVMGTLVDVTFGPGAIVRFLPWSQGEPGRLAGTIRFIDAEGLFYSIEIPPGAVFPDPDAIGEDGLALSAQNIIDYAWEHEWDVVLAVAMMPLAGAPIEVIPEGYFLVGGMVLSETGAHSTAPVDITVPYEDWEIPDGSGSSGLKVLVYNHEQKKWEAVASEDAGNQALRIRTTLISAYAVVWETDAPPDEDDDAARDPDDPEGKKSSSSCFLNTAIPGR